jgi:hypothetical protein
MYNLYILYKIFRLGAEGELAGLKQCRSDCCRAMYEVQFVGNNPISLAAFNTTHFNLLRPNSSLSTRQGFISDFPGKGVGGGINITLNCSLINNPQSLNSCPISSEKDLQSTREFLKKRNDEYFYTFAFTLLRCPTSFFFIPS